MKGETMSYSTPAWGKRYRCPAPAAPFRWKVKGGQKVTATYDLVVRAWRAGIIEDFYCGTRADDDPTVVWLIDGTEYRRDDVAGVQARIGELSRRAGVVSVEWGQMWCGYRALVVTFTSGVVVRQAYNGVEVTESAERAA